MDKELGACAAVFVFAAGMAWGNDQATFTTAGYSAPPHWTGLPAGARVLEYRGLPRSAHANRALILWMISPQKFPRWNEEMEHRAEDAPPYTCPDETRGSFFRGPARVSLVDTVASTIINTVEVRRDEGNNSPDEFDIPYLIHRSYYRVDPPFVLDEGHPVILDLKDYKGDGKALEFALFDAQSCAVTETELIGYSEKHDKVIRYPIDLKGTWWDGRNPTLLWLDRFLLQKPVSLGLWKYTLEYNSGVAFKLAVRYDPVLERFEGTVERRDPPPDTLRPSVIVRPEPDK